MKSKPLTLVVVAVIVVSRAPVSPPYARLAANRALAVLDWDALKLTPDETSALLASVGVDADASMLHEQSGGWAAGRVLLAEHIRRGSAVGSAMDPDSLQQVFAYFAGQLFEQAPEADRRMLMQLSYLPAMSDRLALELTGDEGARAVIGGNKGLLRRIETTDPGVLQDVDRPGDIPP